MHKVKVLLRNRNLVYAGPDETALDAARRMESARVGARSATSRRASWCPAGTRPRCACARS
jgi:hypothetical protein